MEPREHPLGGSGGAGELERSREQPLGASAGAGEC